MGIYYAPVSSELSLSPAIKLVLSGSERVGEGEDADGGFVSFDGEPGEEVGRTFDDVIGVRQPYKLERDLVRRDYRTDEPRGAVHKERRRWALGSPVNIIQEDGVVAFISALKT